ncbi:MAG: hypothetical protein IJT73_01715 [Selenomonadaceae bacterium]|nr:hypothetical protein [Selenomonadaceae bacterium]
MTANGTAVEYKEVLITTDNFSGKVASIKSNAGGYSVALSGGNNVITVSEGVNIIHIIGAESTDKIYVDGGRWVEKDNESGAV